MGQLICSLAELMPRYDALLALQVGEAHTTFPSWDVFSLLPNVEPFWFFEDADTSDEAWDTALPVIVEEADVAHRVIKVGYARKLVEVLVEAGAPVEEALVKKLEVPAEPVQSTGVLLGTVDGQTAYDYTHSNLMRAVVDLGDTADAVTDREFDSVFSQLVAVFSVMNASRPASLHPFPAIHEVLRSHIGSALAKDANFPPAPVVKQTLDILKRAGLPNDQSSTAKLEALGPVFSCHACPRIASHSRLFGRVSMPAADALGWNDVVRPAASPRTVSLPTRQVLTFLARCTGDPRCPGAHARLFHGQTPRDPPHDVDLPARPSRRRRRRRRRTARPLPRQGHRPRRRQHVDSSRSRPPFVPCVLASLCPPPSA